MNYLFWIITSIIIGSLLKISPIFSVVFGIYLAIRYAKPKTTREDYWKKAHAHFQAPATFHHHCFSCMGLLAKADGHVSKEEIIVAQKIMDEMCLNFTQKAIAKSAFKSGGQQHNLANTIAYLKLLKHQRPDLINDFFSYQELIIHADKRNSSNQINILNQVKFHVLEGRQQQRYQQHSFVNNHGGLQNAHQVLGITQKMTYSEKKRTYRKLIGKHHPDRQQTDTAKATAEEKIKRYQSAWDIIHKHHQRTEKV